MNTQLQVVMWASLVGLTKIICVAKTLQCQSLASYFMIRLDFKVVIHTLVLRCDPFDIFALFIYCLWEISISWFRSCVAIDFVWRLDQ